MSNKIYVWHAALPTKVALLEKTNSLGGARSTHNCDRLDLGGNEIHRKPNNADEIQTSTRTGQQIGKVTIDEPKGGGYGSGRDDVGGGSGPKILFTGKWE